MANQDQKPEFLGGAPKFNSVGRDTRGTNDEEPIILVKQNTYWRRIIAVVAVVGLLAALLFYLNDRGLGTTVVAPTRSGHAVSPDAAKPATDPNLK